MCPFMHHKVKRLNEAAKKRGIRFGAYQVVCLILGDLYQMKDGMDKGLILNVT